MAFEKPPEFKCETITPMFCYGADNTKKATPEIRPASIKGAMRFWWRALNPHLNLDEMRSEETKLFGGAGDSNAIKTTFCIKVHQNETKIIEYQPLPHHDNSDFCNDCEKDTRGGECKKSYRKKAITGEFGVDILSKHKSDELDALFKISNFLGGIGQRSRRGFGSFAIKNEMLSLEQVYLYIKLITPTGQYSQKNNSIELSNNFGRNYPYLKSVKIGKCGKVEELLKIIGRVTHKYYKLHYTGYAEGKNRLASPVFVTIIPDQNSHRILISELHAAFPDGWLPKGTAQNKIDFIEELCNA